MPSLDFKFSLRTFVSYCLGTFISASISSCAFAIPIVNVVAPANGSTVSGKSAVTYNASATSAACAKGIAAMRIYTAPGVIAYTVNGSVLKTSIALASGTYNTVVQAWDNCGGVGKTAVTVTVANSAPVTSARFIYTLEGNGVAGWNVNSSTGALSPTGQPVVPAHVNAFRAASDVGGNHLYVANVGSNDVSAFSINRTNGYLTPVPGSPFTVGRPATAVAVHPSGHFVYAARAQDAAGDGVAVFVVNANGSLSPVPGSPFATQNNPLSIVIDPSGKYLYVADSSYQGSVDAFSINQVNGALTPLPGSPSQLTYANGCSGTFPEDLTIDAAGLHLYTADAYDNAISGFNISATTGTLTQVPGSAFANYSCTNPMVAFNPDTLTVESHNKFLYASNGGASTISIYKLGNGGTLSFQKETARCFNGTSSGPILRSDPSGKFLYSIGRSGANCTSGKALIGFSINQTTGDLSAIPGSPLLDSNPTGAVSGAIVITR